MDLLISTLILFAFILPWLIIDAWSKRRDRRVETESEGVGLDYEVAFALVMEAYESLLKQHACGYGPWFSSIIDRSIRYSLEKDERGRVRVVYRGVCPPDVALAAMIKTRDELSRSRFDLSVINEYISILKEM